MEGQNSKTKFGLWGAIFFLFFGGLIFANPNKVIAAASVLLGVFLIGIGIYYLVKNYINTKNDSDTPSTDLILGIVTMILGLLFIILSGTIASVVQYVLGAWILFSGIEKIILAFQSSKNNNNFITQIIVAVLLILVGLYSIFKANITLKVVGLIMMIYAVIEIVSFIVDDTTPKKKEVIKDVKVVEERKEEKEIPVIEIKEEVVEEEVQQEKVEEKPIKKTPAKKSTTTKKTSTAKKSTTAKKATTTKKSSTAKKTTTKKKESSK